MPGRVRETWASRFADRPGLVGDLGPADARTPAAGQGEVERLGEERVVVDQQDPLVTEPAAGGRGSDRGATDPFSPWPSVSTLIRMSLS